jgi:hypothetical protein
MGIYLFCFARAGLVPRLPGTGIDGRSPLILWDLGEVTAVVSMISAEEFCGPSAEARMQELSWLEPRACRHEEVIEHVMRQSPVLPARFGTIFSSMRALEELLEARYDAIRQFLDHVTDNEEWAVKGFLDKEQAKERLLRLRLAEQEGELASTPGVRYLQEQRLRAGVEKELPYWLEEACLGLAARLNPYASEFCERSVLPGQTHGSSAEAILNWALLVPRGAVADFRARVRQATAEHAPHGLTFETIGPWPPYSFVPGG